jgi:hypothetical protein
MSRSIPDREATRVRFLTNMRRLAAITTFLHSGVAGLEQTAPFRSEGVRAELLRALIVFLHAAIEDFVRSHLRKPNKKVSFTSHSDIKLALTRIKADPALFTDLFPPLTQMTKRRHQIVHRADLSDGQNESANSWQIVDDWQLIHWHLAVSAFYRRIRRATGPTNMVEERASQNVEKALVQNLEFGRALSAFAQLPPEERQEGLVRLGEFGDKMLETLKLEVKMFLGPDGEPIEGS